MQSAFTTLVTFGNLIPLLSILIPVLGFLLRPVLNHAYLVVTLGIMAFQLITVSQSVPECANVVVALETIGNSTVARDVAMAHFYSGIVPCAINTLLIAGARAVSTLIRIVAAVRAAM
jgi:hypothetical protein